jgi:hypothetical protein
MEVEIWSTFCDEYVESLFKDTVQHLQGVVAYQENLNLEAARYVVPSQHKYDAALKRVSSLTRKKKLTELTSYRHFYHHTLSIHLQP